MDGEFVKTTAGLITWWHCVGLRIHQRTGKHLFQIEFASSLISVAA